MIRGNANDSADEPRRTINCCHYDDCLDAAAFADVDLVCAGCLRYQPGPIIITQQDIVGSMVFVNWVFGGVVYGASGKNEARIIRETIRAALRDNRL